MKIKKFIAKDYKAAIKRAKEEMGKDAIILQTRQIKPSGWLSFLLKPKVEVTVAVDDTLQVNMDRVRKASFSTSVQEKVKELENDKDNLDADLAAELKELKSMMADIKTQMYDIEVIKGISQEVRHFYEILINNNVDKDIALNIVNNVENRLPPNGQSDTSWIKDVFLHTIQQHINEVKPIEISSDKKGTVVFFVGPTGVGKTTTVAKLAANITFLDRKDVALITLDTYRISAAEQLRTFADIIGIPISVVFEPIELQEEILAYQDKDIILVDTAGRSPYNDQHMAELKEFIEGSNPQEIILVLSAITDSNDLINIYQRFNSIRIDKIIFTKLDEANNYGQVLNALYEIKKPVAYLTNGQNVPDDIQIPDSLYIAKMLLRKDEAL